MSGIPLILIILPLLFQIIVGRKAIGETISLKFGSVCFMSFILQIIFSSISFYVASYNMQAPDGQNYRCGMWMVGFIGLVLIASFLLIVTMIIQYFIKKSYEN